MKKLKGGDRVSRLDWEIYEMMERNPFFKHIGFELVNSSEEEILLKLSIKTDLLNTNKSLHGGVHASMLDTVQSIALRSVYHCPVTAMNLDVHYFAPANTGHLFARAKLLQKGYKMAVLEAEIIDENATLIAKGTGTYKIVRNA